ncbi:hypothetical protein IAT38_004487 [Cryptococcus sp. DSM 104549]
MPHQYSPSIASTSTYAPILINPSSPSPISSAPPFTPALPPTHPRRLTLALRYALPLIPFALLDLSHTVHRVIASGLPAYLTFLGVERVTVLLWVGCTRRWRVRGGWVGAGSGASLVMGIWEGCMLVLSRNDANVGGGKERGEGMGLFLIVFCGLAILEYLLYLLLLRLSPPPDRTNPLALRLPQSHTQAPMPFHFYTEDARLTPGSMRGERSRLHARHPSRGTVKSWRSVRQDEAGEGVSMAVGDDEDVFQMQMEEHSMGDGESCHDEDEDYGDEGEEGEEYGYEEGYDYGGEYDPDHSGEDELDDESDSSSISSSSIIDLPPALSPSTIPVPAMPTLTPSISFSSRLAAMDRSPVIGPLVRRTKSARFLGRSWGSARTWGSGESPEGDAELGESRVGREVSRSGAAAGSGEGYGTF